MWCQGTSSVFLSVAHFFQWRPVAFLNSQFGCWSCTIKRLLCLNESCLWPQYTCCPVCSVFLELMRRCLIFHSHVETPEYHLWSLSFTRVSPDDSRWSSECKRWKEQVKDLSPAADLVWSSKHQKSIVRLLEPHFSSAGLCQSTWWGKDQSSCWSVPMRILKSTWLYESLRSRAVKRAFSPFSNASYTTEARTATFAHVSLPTLLLPSVDGRRLSFSNWKDSRLATIFSDTFLVIFGIVTIL